MIDHRLRARAGFASVCVLCVRMCLCVCMCACARTRACARNSMRAYIEKRVVEVAHKRPMQ